MFSLLLHEINARRNAIIGWGIGLSLFSLMYTLLYPEMEGQLGDLADLSVYQAMGIEMATFEGYLSSTVIGFIPVLLGVYAVMTATATLAGEEDDGTLEMLLATRLPRWQIVLAKGVAILDVLAIIVAIAAIGNLIGFALVEGQITTTVSGAQVFSVVMSALPVVWALAMLALFFAAFMPNRRMAMMTGFLILAASYFGENLGNMVDSAEIIRPLSLLHYFDSSSAVFADGVAASDIIVLLVIAALALGLAIVSFQARDVTVGNWPWQRVRIGTK